MAKIQSILILYFANRNYLPIACCLKNVFLRSEKESEMKKLITLCTVIISVIIVIACKSGNNTVQSPQVEGNYTYEHSFNYDLSNNHLDVHETGTMDFHPDGTALDSARQVYTATLAEGGTATYVFNYVSPSRWRLADEDFYFAGIKESFRMELMETTTVGCDSTRAAELAQEIIKVVSGSCDYEYKFHLDTLTNEKLQWSFTYRDGHSDTWEFHRK